MSTISIIKPSWPAPAHIVAGVSTRAGGVSSTPYNKLNLATHVGDEYKSVIQNRRLLNQYCLDQLKQHNAQYNLHWQWLNQTHSTQVIEVIVKNNAQASTIHADASVCSSTLNVCAVLTADCLPILLCDRMGTTIAAIHAGWRGLANGIVGHAVQSFINSAKAAHGTNPTDIFAWLGPAIGAAQFEVGAEVKQAFLSESFLNSPFSNTKDPPVPRNIEQRCEAAFTPYNTQYTADLYSLANIALQLSGIHQIYGGEYCTVSEHDNFYSYRRDGTTGRMASFIFIAPQKP